MSKPFPLRFFRPVIQKQPSSNKKSPNTQPTPVPLSIISLPPIATLRPRPPLGTLEPGMTYPPENILMFETFNYSDNRALTNQDDRYTKIGGAYPDLLKLNCSLHHY